MTFQLGLGTAESFAEFSSVGFSRNGLHLLRREASLFGYESYS